MNKEKQALKPGLITILLTASGALVVWFCAYQGFVMYVSRILKWPGW